MKIYKTPHWEFHENNQEILYSDGSYKRLPARLSRCLAALLKAQGETLSYDQLLEEVWGTPFRDPNTISAVISELRKLIDSKDPKDKYIVTVPKKGYRFQCDNLELLDNITIHKNKTEASNADLSNTIGIKAENKTQDKWKNNPKIQSIIMVLTMSCVIFGVLIWQLYRSYSVEKVDSKLPSIKYHDAEILTHDMGLELEFDVSKDLQWLAYVHESEDNRRIILKNLQSGIRDELIPKEGELYTSPAFSADGKSMIYRKQKKGQCGIWLAGIGDNGFMPNNRKVTDCGAGESWSALSFGVTNDTIFFARSSNLHEPFKIYIHDIKTGFERSITSPSTSGRGDYSFSLSPDGTKLAIIRNELWVNSSILILNLETDELSKLLTLPNLVFTISWDGNDHLLYVSEHNKLIKLNINSLEHQQIHTEGVVNISLSRENFLFYSRGRRLVSTIWKVNLADLKVTKELESEYLDTYPVFDGDGDLIFKSDRSGNIAIWKIQNNKQSEIIKSDFVKDLHKICLVNDEAIIGIHTKRLMKVNLVTGDFEWLTDDNVKVVNFSISDNEKFITFSSELNENWYLNRLSLDTGEIQSLGIKGFTVKDLGNEILYTKFRQAGLWKTDLMSKKTKLILDDFKAFSSDDWDIVGKNVVSINANVLTVYFNFDEKTYNKKSIKFNNVIDGIHCFKDFNSCIVNAIKKGKTEIVSVKKTSTTDPTLQ